MENELREFIAQQKKYYYGEWLPVLLRILAKIPKKTADYSRCMAEVVDCIIALNAFVQFEKNLEEKRFDS